MGEPDFMEVRVHQNTTAAALRVPSEMGEVRLTLGRGGGGYSRRSQISGLVRRVPVSSLCPRTTTFTANTFLGKWCGGHLLLHNE